MCIIVYYNHCCGEPSDPVTRECWERREIKRITIVHSDWNSVPTFVSKVEAFKESCQKNTSSREEAADECYTCQVQERRVKEVLIEAQLKDWTWFLSRFRKSYKPFSKLDAAIEVSLYSRA